MDVVAAPAVWWQVSGPFALSFHLGIACPLSPRHRSFHFGQTNCPGTRTSSSFRVVAVAAVAVAAVDTGAEQVVLLVGIEVARLFVGTEAVVLLVETEVVVSLERIEAEGL